MPVTLNTFPTFSSALAMQLVERTVARSVVVELFCYCQSHSNHGKLISQMQNSYDVNMSSNSSLSKHSPPMDVAS